MELNASINEAYNKVFKNKINLEAIKSEDEEITAGELLEPVQTLIEGPVKQEPSYEMMKEGNFVKSDFKEQHLSVGFDANIKEEPSSAEDDYSVSVFSDLQGDEVDNKDFKNELNLEAIKSENEGITAGELLEPVQTLIEGPVKQEPSYEMRKEDMDEQIKRWRREAARERQRRRRERMGPDEREAARERQRRRRERMGPDEREALRNRQREQKRIWRNQMNEEEREFYRSQERIQRRVRRDAMDEEEKQARLNRRRELSRARNQMNELRPDLSS